MRVLIVDDHLLIRKGLRQVIDTEYRGVVFGEAETALDAISLLRTHPWDLVLLDIGLPDHDGYQVLEDLRARRIVTPVLIVTVLADPDSVARARRLGASGFLRKGCRRHEIVTALKTVVAGREYFEPSVPPVDPSENPSLHATLSPQEYKVMLALAAGQRPVEIAAACGLHIKTISTYKYRLFKKIGVKSSAGLVRYVIDNHLS